MNEELGFLNYYPLEEHYILCEQYIKSRIDWDEITEEIKQNGVSYFSVANACVFKVGIKEDKKEKAENPYK